MDLAAWTLRCRRGVLLSGGLAWGAVLFLAEVSGLGQRLLPDSPLTSEDPWDYVAPPVTRGPLGADPFFNHTHYSPLAL